MVFKCGNPVVRFSGQGVYLYTCVKKLLIFLDKQRDVDLMH